MCVSLNTAVRILQLLSGVARYGRKKHVDKYNGFKT